MASSMANHAEGEFFFGCAYCSEAFPEQKQLEAHERAMHDGKPFSFVAAPIPDRERGLLHKAPTMAITKNVPLSEVNRHCTPSDCWFAIEGKVFDLTEFVDRHPGGPTTVLKHAGKDVTKMFLDIHKGVKYEQYLRPEAYIGDLGIDPDLMTDEFWHTLRKARIVEIKEEIRQLMEDMKAHPAGMGGAASASSLLDLLQDQGIDADLKAKLQQLETQKRVALDAEDYPKAQAIKAKLDSLLAESKINLAQLQGSGGGIPLSEVARHNKPHDLWVALNGVVYDLTDFLQYHPEQRNSILAWGGRDASVMWNKIPGRFPSSTWMEFYMRPEARMGEVGPEPKKDTNTALLEELRAELRRLEGPSDEDVQAMKAAGAAPKAAEGGAGSEEARFPKLKGITGGRELPFFTRAEVAKHGAGAEPYMILHNKVYDLKPLLGSHPGGDDILLSRAGTDATKEFEVFEHSEKSRVRRDSELLVGELVPAERSDWTAEAAVAGVPAAGAEPASSELSRMIRFKMVDAALFTVGLYAYKSWKHRKPLPKLMYSRALRHMHLIMAVGIFGALGSAQAAARSEGLAKKRWLQIHKQTGIAMLVGLVFRAMARLFSGIPPRFPGNPTVMAIE
eukprot:CAMPEP_0170220062 /NCGR_PEP_ID=MMETSP0116_2-20130129/9720_1 /TAXON_ID=400756 /ORGANISM="Durinskia baltica, Strain CSIRO CS-38" /LENGTH=618 /DNA_ID=CAMNT_0010470743 /DNA_START=75 /DNA_END=1928 /DNA_ORIENTATION=+